MMYSRVALDMDGVLADFDKAILRVSGYHPSELTEAEIWGHVRNTKDFFLTLEKTPECGTILRAVLELIPLYRLRIVTALPRRDTVPDAAGQKTRWVRTVLGLGTVPVVTMVGSKNKWKYAMPGELLIDDRPSNCREWIENNPGKGTGAIYHASTALTLTRLREHLAAE